ncbi:probable glycosyltransferase At5g03795 [Carya illinoinensis]|uniref:probable glycosyltransferase At5g03795 n=1 Tax=Carya illinoinensis TaxID=32201 RepID=UPI001C72699A|nr:probable glycosyltransferase At5g03795 [Carya illinoinensis]
MQFSDKRTFCSFYRQQSSLIFFILFVVVALVVMISVIQRTLGDERSSEFFKTPDSPYSSSSTLPQTGERQERIEKKKESDKINVTTGKSRVKRQYSTLEKIEASLGIARSAIKEAGRTHNLTSTHDDPGYVPRGPIYGNANAFTGTIRFIIREKKKM